MFLLFVSLGCQRDERPNNLERIPVANPEHDVDVTATVDATQQLLTAGRYRQAEQRLRPLLLSEPHHADALFLLAQSQAGQGHLGEAIETLDGISSDNPQLGLAALGQASDWLIQLQRYDEAQSRLERVVSEYGDIVMAHRRLAELLNNQGLRIEAAPHLRALARLGDVSAEELYGLSTFSDPFVHSDLNDETPAIPSSKLNQARILYYDGKPREAILLAEPSKAQLPNSPSVAAFLLRLAADMQDESAFSRCLAKLPAGIQSQPEYWYGLGVWHQHHDQNEIAIRCFLEAVRRDDTDRFSYLGLARSLEASSYQTEANVVMQHYALLDEAAAISVEIDRTPAQLRRIAELMIQLKRPYEAVAWERMAVGRRVASRDAEVTADREPEDESWRLCGLKIDDWPLPEFESLAETRIDKSVDSMGESPMSKLAMVNVADKVGLHFRYRPGPEDDCESLLMPETVGGGIAVIDYDRDGWPDLYFTQGGGIAFDASGSLPNRLWRNLAGSSFTDVSPTTQCDDRGYGQGAAAADVNQDGFTDLIVANIGPNVLYLNNGDGTFAKTGLGGSSAEANQWTTSIACGDLSGDQLPDIVEVNYIDDEAALTAECVGSTPVPLCNPQRYRAAADRFLVNRGDGQFESWTAARTERPAGYGFAAIIANFDETNGNDLFVANDTSGNHYWLSQIDGEAKERFTLVEQAELLGCARGPHGIFQSSMGIAGGDFDHNGRIDLQITNYTDESSDLLLQQPTGIFANQCFRYGLDQVTRAHLGWGTQAADLDNDGWLDLAVLNGNLYNHSSDGSPYRMAPQVIRGTAGQFTNVEPETLSDSFWTTPTLGRTLATIDWNRDGKVDLVAGHLDAPVALLENHTQLSEEESQVSNWIQLELVGTLCERDAVGAKATISAGGREWTAWSTGGDGYLCSNDPIISFGLGQQHAIDSIAIQWPSGDSTVIKDCEVNQRLQIVQGEREPWGW